MMTARTAEMRDIFDYELPDPYRILFLQSYDTPNTFTCFPKITLELRLMVWRFAFRTPASVEVNPSYRHFNLFASPARLPPKELPITLRINRESRMETLNHYSVLEWNRDPRSGPPVNPEDLLCLLYRLTLHILYLSYLPRPGL